MAPQGVEPTLYGRALVKRSIAIFNDLRNSLDEIESLSNPMAGELRIGATESMGAGLLPVLIDRLTRRYPGLSFDVIQADPATLEERDLRGRRIELAIMRRTSAPLLEDLEETVLYKDRLRVVAGVESPWAKRRKIALADLVGARWCLPPPDHPVGALVIDAFRRGGLEPPRRTVTVGISAVDQQLGRQGSVSRSSWRGVPPSPLGHRSLEDVTGGPPDSNVAGKRRYDEGSDAQPRCAANSRLRARYHETDE